MDKQYRRSPWQWTSNASSQKSAFKEMKFQMRQVHRHDGRKNISFLF
jgi:hypothetical protein